MAIPMNQNQPPGMGTGGGMGTGNRMRPAQTGAGLGPRRFPSNPQMKQSPQMGMRGPVQMNKVANAQMQPGDQRMQMGTGFPGGPPIRSGGMSPSPTMMESIAGGGGSTFAPWMNPQLRQMMDQRSSEGSGGITGRGPINPGDIMGPSGPLQPPPQVSEPYEAPEEVPGFADLAQSRQQQGLLTDIYNPTTNPGGQNLPPRPGGYMPDVVNRGPMGPSQDWRSKIQTMF